MHSSSGVFKGLVTIGGMGATLPRIRQVLVIYVAVTIFTRSSRWSTTCTTATSTWSSSFDTFPRAWLAMFVLSTTELYLPHVPTALPHRRGPHDDGPGRDAGSHAFAHAHTAAHDHDGLFERRGDHLSGLDSTYAGAGGAGASSFSPPERRRLRPFEDYYHRRSLATGSNNDDGSNDDDGDGGGGTRLSEPEVVLLRALVVLFFVSYLVLLVYLILNMKLAAIYDSWCKVHEKQLLTERLRQYHAMIVAHAALSDNDHPQSLAAAAIGAAATERGEGTAQEHGGLLSEPAARPLPTVAGAAAGEAALRIPRHLAPSAAVHNSNKNNNSEGGGGDVDSGGQGQGHGIVDLREWILRGVDALTSPSTRRTATATTPPWPPPPPP